MEAHPSLLSLLAPLILERFHDTIELLIPALPQLAFGIGAPRVLLGCVQAPDYNVAATAPVIMPGGVEGAPALTIVRAAQYGVEGWFELGEEDEVVGPFMLWSLIGGLSWYKIMCRRGVAWSSRDVSETASHILA